MTKLYVAIELHGTGTHECQFELVGASDTLEGAKQVADSEDRREVEYPVETPIEWEQTTGPPYQSTWSGDSSHGAWSYEIRAVEVSTD